MSEESQVVRYSLRPNSDPPPLSLLDLPRLGNLICRPCPHPFVLTPHSSFPLHSPHTVSVVASGSCSKISAATVEVWHALPSGSYSSLDPEKEADCRGTYKSGGSFTVSTLVPGSYGLLNGLGPSGFDTPPYGPKLIHFRVTAPGYKTLVTEVQLGEGLDFRGPSMVIDGVRTSVEGLLEGESGNMSGKGECLGLPGRSLHYLYLPPTSTYPPSLLTPYLYLPPTSTYPPPQSSSSSRPPQKRPQTPSVSSPYFPSL